MIELDRDAPLPLAEQLVEAMRYEVASGKYAPGARLPSTRVLGKQLDISFHTVRKAYQRLAEEGILDVRRGGGYIVIERQILSKAERLERGAAVVEEALHKLVGLGLDESEVIYVVNEGVEFFERPGGSRSLVFAASCRELAESGAEQAGAALQDRVVPVALKDLEGMTDLDGVIVPMPDVSRARRSAPEAEAVGTSLQYPLDVLERIARLGSSESLGLITRYPDGVAPLSDDIRRLTGFGGPLLALAIEADRLQVETVVRQAALVAFSPQARRRVRPILNRLGAASVEFAPSLATASLARIRDAFGV